MEMEFRDSVTCVGLGTDGSQLLAGSADETVRLYDIRAGAVQEVAVGDPVVDVCLNIPFF
jgi:WD40 repeat protein